MPQPPAKISIRANYAKQNGAHPKDARRKKLLAVICLLSASFYSVHRFRISVALMPPKPNEFDKAISKLWAMALLGT